MNCNKLIHSNLTVDSLQENNLLLSRLVWKRWSLLESLDVNQSALMGLFYWYVFCFCHLCVFVLLSFLDMIVY